MNREEEIRLIAYHIWEQDGRQDGKDILHWTHAELIWESRQKAKHVQNEAETDTRVNS